MGDRERPVVLKDSTLREGLDVPGVRFSATQKLQIVAALAAAGVPEAEVVAPSRVERDLKFARKLRECASTIRVSGLLYANWTRCEAELERASTVLDRVDLLMPLSEQREPRERPAKLARLLEVLAHSRCYALEVGAGFPHATQADSDFVLEIARRAVAAGARRVTVYDTNGGADPFTVGALVGRLSAALPVPVFFHAHNDLGLATANAWAAVVAGAAGLDVTINGLGDRAGNASLEQVATLLHLKAIATGVRLSELPKASRLVERLSGVPVSRLAPVVGKYVFEHRSPAHLRLPREFEAFDPAKVRRQRRVALAGGAGRTTAER
jgi:homocitrate synthase NifV